MVPCQQLQPAVLGAVRVLVLVDQHVAEAVFVLLTDVRVDLEQLDALEQQVVEVHRVHRVDLALVAVVHVGRGLLEIRAHLVAVALGVEQHVLRRADLALDRARREALRVDLEIVDASLHEPDRVLFVIDREAARIAELVAVGAEHAGTRRVERHHPHRLDAGPDELRDPLAHLLRRLVREGDRQDLAGRRLVGVDQMGDPVGQNARLPAARAREHKQGAALVEDGLLLGVVQAFEKALGGGRGGHNSSLELAVVVTTPPRAGP